MNIKESSYDCLLQEITLFCLHLLMSLQITNHSYAYVDMLHWLCNIHIHCADIYVFKSQTVVCKHFV